jgi:ankyrin repeat protein
MKNFPLELIDIICSCINKKLLRDISFEKNTLYILNKKRIKNYWRKSGIYRLAGNINDLNGIKYLVSQGIDIREKNVQLLKVASSHGNLKIVKYILKTLETYGIFNDKWDINCIFTGGIIYSSMCGHLNVVKFLVEQGTNPNIHNLPIIFASSNGHLEVVKYLVSVGVNITDYDNWAVRLASENGHLEVVKYLVSVGADITDRDNYAVRLASENGHLEVVKYIISLPKWKFFTCKIKKFVDTIFKVY